MTETDLDLLNRKNAENENYSHNIKTMTDSIYKMQKRIEVLNYENLQMLASIKGLEERARAEAIKEFAERVKRYYSHLKEGSCGASIGYYVDQIAKEMGVEL